MEKHKTKSLGKITASITHKDGKNLVELTFNGKREEKIYDSFSVASNACDSFVKLAEAMKNGTIGIPLKNRAEAIKFAKAWTATKTETSTNSCKIQRKG